MRPAIILFAKAPMAGRVKTRLQGRLSPSRTAGLHEAFVRDMLELLQSFRNRADIELHTDIITDAWSEAGVTQALQCEGDLGLKMLQALDHALKAGRPRCLILGADAPTLPSSHIDVLLRSEADVALGPTEDGGYYGISCRRVHPEMFERVRWSAPDALETTKTAATRCGLSVETGPQWFDIDTGEDLDRLLACPKLPRHTAKFLGISPGISPDPNEWE